MGTHFHTFDSVDSDASKLAAMAAKHNEASVTVHLRAAFDKAFALGALIFFAPFMLAVCALLLIREGRPVFFGHTRIGKNGKTFKCLKFRTMAVDANERLARLLASDAEARKEWEATQKLESDPRVTCLGLLLRKSSLDELPQFLNVLKGDMALVGPRPIVAEEAIRYGENFGDYISVKPGITGVWQVSGRSDVSYDQRVEMDVEYVKNRSFSRDLKIILKTVKVVLTRDGAC
ncbi:sugar transferase [Marimonas lutisalis]|uniref:sugar transferase n=1 Tax=Marimonas lutisalis TaxID=2545756 RepID=UPI0010F57FED|nr:sugar transferase [Marimonas lutisalis]